MKDLNQELQRSAVVQTNMTMEENKFDTGFKDAEQYRNDEKTKEGSKKSFKTSFSEVTKEDGISKLRGDAPVPPQYIGMERKYTEIQRDDSEKMATVRAALKTYIDKKESGGDISFARDNLLTACDIYCKGRMDYFKSSEKATKRLEEVKALREQVMEENGLNGIEAKRRLDALEANLMEQAAEASEFKKYLDRKYPTEQMTDEELSYYSDIEKLKPPFYNEYQE